MIPQASSCHRVKPSNQVDSVRRPRVGIPAFALYGEAPAPGSEVLHMETIQERSRRYHWQIDAHIHHGLYQVILLQTGPGRVSLDAVQEECDAPSAIVIPPGVVHGFQFTHESQGHVLTLSAKSFIQDDLSEIGQALRHLFSVPRILPMDSTSYATERLSHLCDELAVEFRSPDSSASPVPQWLARSVVWRLARISVVNDATESPGARLHHALFTRFVLLVESHYLEHLGVAEYADQLGLSPDRLNRLVRAESGRNALDFIHERLLREACRKLIYVAAPIAKLSFELGFRDAAYFCRFFKRQTGVSPGTFRRENAAQSD